MAKLKTNLGPNRTRPRRRKYPIEIACVAWVDLLGYGAMLEQAAFNPDDERAVRAIQRLRGFQQTAVRHAERWFPAMPINDGVAYFVDLSPRSTSVAADFLHRAVEAHAEINRVEREAGYPGARTVIAVGPRARIARPKRREAHLRSIFRRLGEGLITTAHAINEAFVSTPVAGFVPQLQANFAFTRAYLANDAGSHAGLGGPNCYIDMMLFEDPNPDWIVFSRTLRWQARALDVQFGQFASVDWKRAGRERFSGLRSHSSIAALLNVTVTA